MSLKTSIAAAILFSSSLAAHAATLDVTDIGLFSATTPITAYSAPGAVYSFSFNVSSTPAISDVRTGVGFVPSISNFIYTLIGATNTPPATVAVLNTLDGGLLTVCFTSPCDGSLTSPLLFFHGPQVYSGSEANPTILTGAYTPSGVEFEAGSNLVTEPTSPIVINAVPTTVSAPEISASGLSSGFVLLSGAILILREKKRFRTAPLA